MWLLSSLMILANQMKTPRTGLSIILLKNMSFNYMISYLILLFPSLVKALKTFKCMSNKWRRQIIATFFQQLLISYKGSSENRSKLNMKNNLWWPKFRPFKIFRWSTMNHIKGQQFTLEIVIEFTIFRHVWGKDPLTCKYKEI